MDRKHRLAVCVGASAALVACLLGQVINNASPVSIVFTGGR
jgi:hypothetical protein